MIKIIFLLTFFSSGFAQAGQYYTKDNLGISSIRAVGEYSSGMRHSNSIEIHFTQEISWPDEAGCSDKIRLFINAKHTHLVSAVYMAFAANKPVGVTIDREFSNFGNGFCEISYLDILK